MKSFKLFVEEFVQDKKFRSSGSNDAVKLDDSEGKHKSIFVKYYNDDHNRENTEIAAAKFYELVGIKTTVPRDRIVVKNSSGKRERLKKIYYRDSYGQMQSMEGLISGFAQNLRPLSNEKALELVNNDPNKLKEFILLFLVSVLVRNHDVIGMFNDNTMINDNNELTHVDAGGAFHFKATGGFKSPNRNKESPKDTDEDYLELPDYPEELETMMMNGKLSSARFFFKLFKLDFNKTLDEFEKAIKIFEKKITDNIITSVITKTWKYNNDGTDQIELENNSVPVSRLIEKLQNRRKEILANYKDNLNKLEHMKKL